MTSLYEFGKELSKVQDSLPANPHTLSRGRADFLAAAAEKSRQGSRRRVPIVIGIASGLAAAAMLLLALSLWGSKLEARIGDTARKIEIGEWIAPTGSTPTTIDFSDGSKIILEPHAGARIAKLEEHGARFQLEKGIAQATIIHNGDTTWIVDVGPYTVRVTGTAFKVEWAPDDGRFALALDEGNVVVTGPLVDDGRRLVEGQQMTAWVKEKRLEVRAEKASRIQANPSPLQTGTEPSKEQPAPKSTTDPVVEDTKIATTATVGQANSKRKEEAGTPAANVSTSPIGAKEKTDDTGPSWQDLARRGDFAAAMEKVDALGFDRVAQACTSKELALLADVSRLSGRYENARKSYLQLRDRFPGSRQAAIAAFSLGRMAFDQQHLYAESARWLDTFLSESPGGGLAREEALGRLMEARNKSGDLQGAQAAAKTYVEKYPQGPHAEYGKKILSENQNN